MRILRNSSAVAACAYLAIIIYIFWPILLPPEGTLVFGDDIHRSYHFFRQLFGDAIRNGQFPWWNPYLFSGEPLIANPSLAFWYPVNWLFAVFPYRFVFSWTIPLHIFWAMLGMNVLLRSLSSPRRRGSSVGEIDSRFRGNDKGGSGNDTFQIGPWLAGLIFGLSGYFMGRVWEGHIELITSASWMPWVVYTNVKCQMSNVKWKINCVIAGMVFALQLLAGYQTMAMFTLEAVLIIALFQSFLVKSLQPLLRAGLAGLTGLALAAIQIIPSQEFFRASIRTYPLPYSWAVFGSYTMENLKQLWNPFILGFPWKYQGPSPNFGEMAAYMSKGGLALAFFSIVTIISVVIQKLYKRSNEVTKLRIYDHSTLVFGGGMVCIAIFGLWVSLGWNAPIDLNKILWDIAATYRYLRIPSRHLILFVFGMSALAGIGFSLVQKFSFARHRLAKLVISMVITVDLVWFARHFVALKPDPVTRHNKELVTYLQKNSGLTRLLPNFNVGMGTRDALDFDAVMGYKLFSASGYDPAILRNYYEFAAAVAGIENPDVQTSDVQIPYLKPASRYTDFLNVKHILVPSWFDSVAGSSPKYKLVMEENTKDYFRLYENTAVLPRFFLVPNIVGLPNREAIARAIRVGEYDPGNTVLVEEKYLPQPIPSDCGKAALPPVVVTSYSINTVTLTTDAPCNAALSTSEVMYPGWTASVDGKPATLIEGNLAFRTLPVPAGRHTIVLWYQPRIFLIGTIISMITGAICVLWIKRGENGIVKQNPLSPARIV